MVKIGALGLLIAGTTPIALANSSQGISLSNRLQFSFEQSQAAVQTDEVNVSSVILARGTTDCDKSAFSCPTKISNFTLTDSDFGYRKLLLSYQMHYF